MIEPNTEDRAEAERIKKEYLKIQERIAIRGLISAKIAVLLEESQALQSWLDSQAETMKTFASTQVPADLSGAFTGGAADSIKEVLGAVPKPSLTSPILQEALWIFRKRSIVSMTITQRFERKLVSMNGIIRI